MSVRGGRNGALTLLLRPASRSRCRPCSVWPTPLMVTAMMATTPRTWSACICVMNMREMLPIRRFEWWRRRFVPSAASKTDDQHGMATRRASTHARHCCRSLQRERSIVGSSQGRHLSSAAFRSLQEECQAHRNRCQAVELRQYVFRRVTRQTHELDRDGRWCLVSVQSW